MIATVIAGGLCLANPPYVLPPKITKPTPDDCETSLNRGGPPRRAALGKWPWPTYLCGMGVDLFETGRDEAALHPQFKTLRDSPLYEPARGLLREIGPILTDADGNLVEQFQTFGFDARTFEIFLFALFADIGQVIDRSNDRPDFLLRRGLVSVAVEAVTANPTPSKVMKPYSPLPKRRSREEVAAYLSGEVAIRFGSPLYSKLAKRYWELPHVAGKPFVLAIESFHEQGSLTHSSSALGSYLFGIRQRWYHDEAGKLIITPEAISAHRNGTKQIPSGFFNQLDAENVSAILFCNSGTVPKFNRMGHQGAHSSPNVRMLRYGTCYSWAPEAAKPEPFIYEVGDPLQGKETWGEGAVVFHNPNARHPLPPAWLGASSEERLEGGNICATILQDFHPYMSLTLKFRGDTPTAVIQREHDRLLGGLLEMFPLPAPR
jgi:hypothetical protein